MQVQNLEYRVLTNFVKTTVIQTNSNLFGATNSFVLLSGYMWHNKEKHSKIFQQCKSSNHTHTHARRLPWWTLWRSV
jgi:hypothetical protein